MWSKVKNWFIWGRGLEWCFGAILLGFVLFFVLGAWNEVSHGGCAESEPTGEFSCFSLNGVTTRCKEIRHCTRYGDGTTPK